MSYIKEHIETILIITVVVLATLQLNSFLGCNQDKSYKVKLELKDSLYAIKQREVDALNKSLSVKDTIISGMLQQVNSVLSNIDKHQVVYKPIYDELKKIPVRIAAISGNDDAIKAAFSRREGN